MVIEKFLLVGTQEEYDALTSPDEDKLYFCSDTKNIYKGSVLYTDAIRKVTVKPTTPAVGKLYFILDSDTIEFYNGSEWINITAKNNTLPIPTDTQRGGIIASTKTDDYTVEVKIGEDGKLYVPSYSDIKSVTSTDITKIEVKTQSEYDNLPEKDPNTLYLIKYEANGGAIIW